MKSNKSSKDKNQQQPIVNEVGGEKVKDVSYFQLYKFSTGKEKVMILISVLSALVQGLTLPIMLVFFFFFFFFFLFFFFFFFFFFFINF